ncbi:hypothetical protein [Geosporobacter ferrireducens]|uniref:LXG domain-containing protein n=1 Tax=Geosporobacter ferrireducens TaxID=1424294 RepID=A0A1D8GKP9_9FIRM|nr:hypothetical protein [Geosporobacter ferrireducens]AOT71498.1 hypothetical protein Gferi_19365 [Geosporobacter ferrireducens]MTI57809.1 hypothetical protein [Geosporobacter ferrireducens]
MQNLLRKRVFMILSVVICFSNSFIVSFGENADYEKGVTGKRIQMASADSSKELTREEKYNKTYGEYITILMGFYNAFVELKKTAEAGSEESISGKCYSLMTSVDKTLAEASNNLEPEPKYAYSKTYLTDSYRNLKNAINNLDMYDLYIVINDLNAANDTMKKIDEDIKKYNENYTEAFNYFSMVKGGKTVPSNLNETEQAFYNYLKGHHQALNDIYKNLNSAYEMVKENENPTELMKETFSKLNGISFQNLKTQKNRNVMIILNELTNLGNEALIELESYFIDVISASTSSDDKFVSALDSYKTKLNELNTVFAKIESEAKDINKNVAQTVREIQEKDYEEAKALGYSTIEEYYQALIAANQHGYDTVSEYNAALQDAKNKGFNSVEAYKETNGIQTLEDLEKYLNKHFSELETPQGEWFFKFHVSAIAAYDKNGKKISPYDFLVNTDWFNQSPGSIDDAVNLTAEQKQQTKDMLRDFQKKVADIAINAFPNKKIQGGFYTVSTYSKSTLTELRKAKSFEEFSSVLRQTDSRDASKITEYTSFSFLTWRNFKSATGSEAYDDNKITEFFWYTKDDKFKF